MIKGVSMEQTEQKIDKRTKEYRESVQEEGKPDYENPKNNPGWKLCMYCGGELPPNEDGTVKWRKFQEPCSDCIWRNK